MSNSEHLSSGQHDFDNTVVAVLDRQPEVRSASEGLEDSGYEYEILVGEPGREHLDPTSDEGVLGTVKRIVKVFGDQHRIIDRLDQALSEGKTVVSVEVDDADSSEAISILRDHGGHYIWKLGEWTFTPIGDKSKESSES